MKQARVSGAGLVWVLLKKDILAYSRDRLYSILSLAGLIMFIAVFFLMPDRIEENLVLGVHHYDLGELFSSGEVEEGFEIIEFQDQSSLQRVIGGKAEAWITENGSLVIRGEHDPKPQNAHKKLINVGLSFPEGFLVRTAMGDHLEVKLFVNHDTPQEIRSAMSSFVREAAFQISGSPLPVTQPDPQEVILGVDRMGAQITMRERMRPMLAFFMLMMETFALSSLIAYEIIYKTLTAVLATPVKLRHVLTAKTIFGTFLTMSQTVILFAAIGSFTFQNTFLLLAVLFVGALMFTSIGMLVGSLGRDFLENLFLTMACIIPMMIPAFGALIPGSTAPWVRFVPSYGIMQSLISVTAYGASWGEIIAPLSVSAFWTVLLLGAALWVLGKKAVRI